jgi:hypothetical protein
MEVTIEHHNGTETVEDFTEIVECGNTVNRIRVFYEEEQDATMLRGPTEDGRYFKEFVMAQVTHISNESNHSDDSDSGGSTVIDVDP